MNLSVDECISEGILVEFLSKHKAEAIAVSIYEYDEEKHLKNLYEEGKAESILELLEALGAVPQIVQKRICEERNFATLGKWLKTAVRVSSVEEFEADAFGK